MSEAETRPARSPDEARALRGRPAREDTSDRHRLPVRPSVPPTLWVLICVVACERMGLHARGVPWWWVALAGSLAVGLAACGYRGVAWGRSGIAWATSASLASCALALAVTGATLARGQAFADSLAGSAVSSWRFEVVSDASQTAQGLRYRARAVRGQVAQGDVWLRTSEPLVRGEVVRVVGRFSAAADDAWGDRSVAQGVWGTVAVVRVLERTEAVGLCAWPLAVRRAARAVVEPESSSERAVLAGCVVADRTAMDALGLDDLFSRCGVAHLVAVSGAHMATVASIVGALVAGVHAKPAVRLALTLGSCGAFVLVCGAPPSAVRAYLMSASSALATLAGRRADGLSAAALAALVMALVDPYVTGQMGYLLSVICVVGLRLFGRYATYALGVLAPDPRLPQSLPSELRIRLRKAQSWTVSGLAAALVCQVVSAPIVLPAFSRVALVGPLAALVTAPPLAAMMTCGILAVCLSWLEPARAALLAASDLCAYVALTMLRALSRVPFASVAVEVAEPLAWVASILVAVALFLWWPRVSRVWARRALAGALALAIVLFVRWRYCAPARLCVLDVGQGDAILVQDGTAALLVDTGPDGAVARALSRQHVLHLDGVLLTHLHDDHYGGLDELVASVPCGRVYVARGVASHLPAGLAESVKLLTGGTCEELAYGDVLRVGSFELEFVWPRTEVTGEVNADSIELLVTYGVGARTLSALLTGDAERDETGEVIAAGDVGDIDVLKVGHHGSEVSLTERQAETLLPEVAVASAGEGNRYGHPHPECVEVLEGVGAVFLCTKDVGDVEVQPGDDGPVVHCQRAAPG